MKTKAILLLVFFCASVVSKGQTPTDIDHMNYLFNEYGGYFKSFINNGKLLVEHYSDKVIEIKDITGIKLKSGKKYFNYGDDEPSNYNTIIVMGKWYFVEKTSGTEVFFEGPKAKYRKGYTVKIDTVEIDMDFREPAPVKAAAGLLKKITGFSYDTLPKLSKESIGGIADMKPLTDKQIIGTWKPIHLNYGGLAKVKLEREAFIEFCKNTGTKATEAAIKEVLALNKNLLVYYDNGSYEYKENGKVIEEGTYIIDKEKRTVTDTQKTGTEEPQKLYLKKGTLSLMLNNVLSLGFEKIN